MKKIVRFLLGPIVRWAAGPIIAFHVAEEDIGRVIHCITDGWGEDYELELTPDEARTKAWEIIGLADEVERAMEAIQ